MVFLWNFVQQDRIYQLSTIDSESLTKTHLEVITGLAHYGFIVNKIASDGASENRAASKKLATLTAQAFLINNQVKLDELKNTGFLSSNIIKWWCCYFDRQ